MEAGTDDLQNRVAALVHRVVEDSGCFVVEIGVRGTVGSHAVNVFVESDDTLDARMLSQLSREIGYVLDVEDVMPGSYRLMVSSPGLDRPLRLARQYRKMVGRDMRVHFQKSEGKFTEACGKLVAAGEEEITISRHRESMTIRYSDILWSKVLLPW